VNRVAHRTAMIAALLLGMFLAGVSTADQATAEPARKSKAERRAKPDTPRAGPATQTEAGKFIAGIQSGRADVPRIELAARLKAGGFEDTNEYRTMREQAAREVVGRPDGVGGVTPDEIKRADDAIARQIANPPDPSQPPSLADVARQSGRPQVPGLNIVYLHPLGRPADANKWQNIIAHQTEGAAGAARSSAAAQFANPTKRGVMLWVETDGTVFWATAEHAIPTHGDGANRNDNKYIDNSKTHRNVIKTNSVGVEFVGNFPDVAKPVTPEQEKAWLVLVRFLQERYGISSEHIYAHNWIDYKDSRYCEGCDLATLARKQAYEPGQTAAKAPD
jgi:N-acetylmuramoyl-L-alanine amidase